MPFSTNIVTTMIFFHNEICTSYIHIYNNIGFSFFARILFSKNSYTKMCAQWKKRGEYQYLLVSIRNKMKSCSFTLFWFNIYIYLCISICVCIKCVYVVLKRQKFVHVQLAKFYVFMTYKKKQRGIMNCVGIMTINITECIYEGKRNVKKKTENEEINIETRHFRICLSFFGSSK